MSDQVPDFLKDEFTQEAWDELTDEERSGMIEDGDDDSDTDEPGDNGGTQQEEQHDNDNDDDQTDEEREAAAAAATEAAAAAKQPTEEEQAAAAAAAQQPAEEQPTITPRPSGVINATLPEDYDDRVQANEKAMADLDAQYDNGDISHEEWRKGQRALDRESRELDRIKDRYELAQETSHQALITHWRGIIDPFTAAHPELSKDQQAMQDFDAMLKMATGPVMAAGGMPGQAEVDKAYRMWCAARNFTPTTQQQPQKPGQRQPNRVPPTLGGLPSADPTAVEDGKLAAIRRLEGEDYDNAFAKLSEAEQELLLMHG